MTDVIAIGELLIDLIAEGYDLPLKDQTTFKRFAGGAPANFAVGVKCLGLTSGLITKVGNDFFGDFLLDTLKEKEVDISQIRVTKEFKTALAFVGLDENRSPSFSFYRSPCADIMLKVEEINENYIKSAKLLMYGTVSMADEPARSAIFQAIKYAKKQAIAVAYPGWMPSSDIREYARQQQKQIFTLTLDELPGDLAVRLQHLHFISTHLKRHPQSDGIVSRFIG